MSAPEGKADMNATSSHFRFGPGTDEFEHHTSQGPKVKEALTKVLNGRSMPPLYFIP